MVTPAAGLCYQVKPYHVSARMDLRQTTTNADDPVAVRKDL
jgi:hypothetical protein